MINRKKNKKVIYDGRHRLSISMFTLVLSFNLDLNLKFNRNLLSNLMVFSYRAWIVAVTLVI